MTNDDATTVAESLSEIADAVLRLATEIKDKNIQATVVIKRGEIEESAATSTHALAPPDSQPQAHSPKTAAFEPLPAEMLQEQPATSQPTHERPQPLRVENQERVIESDGTSWIVSTRIYSDGVLRTDRRPYKSSCARSINS